MIASLVATAAAVSLSVAPARLSMAPGTAQTVSVTNTGKAAVVVGISTAGYALDLRGRARVLQRAGSRAWLSLRPARLALAPGATGSLTVAAHRPRGARPGDHEALVLLTSLPRSAGALAVRMRVGVVVAVRVPGRVVERLDVTGLRRARAGLLELALVNRGDVVEQLAAPSLSVSLWRQSRLIERLPPQARDLLPHTRGLAAFRYAPRLRGWVTAVVQLGQRLRVFRLRL